MPVMEQYLIDGADFHPRIDYFLAQLRPNASA